MNNEILKNISDTYEFLKSRREQITTDLKKLNSGKIKDETEEYYRILEETTGTYQNMIMNFKDADLLARACYLNLNSSVKSSKIYLYLGTYMYSVESDGIRMIKVRFDNKKADCRWYKDIENYEDKLVMIPFTKKFETSNKIVYTSVAAKPTTQNDIFEKIYYGEVYKVQHDFVKLALDKGTKEAIKDILLKYAKENIQFI